jgi:inner membrane protein
MDSLTQAVLGAAVGEFIAGKKMGNKAILWGAVAGTIPDLDVVFAPFVDDMGSLLWHRSFSHSILVFLLLAPAIGWLASRRSAYDGKLWTRLYFWGFLTHALLDTFTVFGTQLLWPLSSYGFAFNTIFIIDPVYTLPMLMSLLIVLWLKRESDLRRRIANLGLVISTAYLALTLLNKKYIDSVFYKSFERQGIEVEHYMSNPAPLTNLLWYGLAKGTDGVLYYGLYSILDLHDQVDFMQFKSDEGALEKYRSSLNESELARFDEFVSKAKGFELVALKDGKLEYYDTRFSYWNNFDNGGGYWVFSYLLDADDAGNIIVQTKESEPSNANDDIRALAFRIFGK